MAIGVRGPPRGDVAPILKRLIAVNMFVPPRGLRIVGSVFFLCCWGGVVGVKAINLFEIGAHMGLDVTASGCAPILKRLIAVNTFVSPWDPKIMFFVL